MSLYLLRSFWNPFMQYRCVLIWPRINCNESFYNFSSIRSDINQTNKYKIELVFFPYDIVFYFYGHSQKKDGNTRAIFAPSAPSFSPYLFVMRQLLIIKRNMVFWRRILFQVTPIKTACLRWGDVFHSAMDSLCNKGHTEKEHDKKCRRFYSIYVFFSFCAF